MTSLIQEIETSHAYKHHLQDGIPDKHSSHNTGKRHQIVFQSQGLCLSCECSQDHVWKHSKDITEVVAYIRHSVQAEGAEQASPSALVSLLWQFLFRRLCGLGCWSLSCNFSGRCWPYVFIHFLIRFRLLFCRLNLFRFLLCLLCEILLPVFGSNNQRNVWFFLAFRCNLSSCWRIFRTPSEMV